MTKGTRADAQFLMAVLSFFHARFIMDKVINGIISKILWVLSEARKPFTNIYCFVISCRIRYNSGSTYYF